MRVLATVLACVPLVACATSPQGPSTAPGCERVATLSAAGEHKPAVDEMAKLEEEGFGCSRAVERAVESSRATAVEADALVEAARDKRATGDLIGAKRDLLAALDLYPKYYWASKRLRELDQDIEAEATGFQQRAALQEGAGDLQGALESLHKASALTPSDSQLATHIAHLRRRVAEEDLEFARRAEYEGDLDEAAHRLLAALDRQPADPSLRTSLVEQAKLLGLKLFSDGRLTMAKEVWTRALTLDGSNQKLEEYLDEVDARLESLERVKAGED